MVVVKSPVSRPALRLQEGAGLIEELHPRAPVIVRTDPLPSLSGDAPALAPAYIEPDSPWENPFVESFNGRVGDEPLNVEEFGSLVEAWRIE